MLTPIRCPFQPELPQWHVEDPGHFAKSEDGRLHLNMHTPLTQRSRSGLTMSKCLLHVNRIVRRDRHPHPCLNPSVTSSIFVSFLSFFLSFSIIFLAVSCNFEPKAQTCGWRNVEGTVDTSDWFLEPRATDVSGHDPSADYCYNRTKSG